MSHYQFVLDACRYFYISYSLCVTFVFQIVDGSYVCPVCSYPMCSVECSMCSVHTQECAVLKGVQRSSEGVNYKIVAVIRLLHLINSCSDIWEQIGKALKRLKLVIILLF